MPEVSIRSMIRRRILNTEAAFKDALKEDLEAPAKKLTAKHRRVVSQWSGKPIFAYRITAGRKVVRVTVFPKGAFRQRYLWVDRGTQPYTIRPKNGGFLKFQTGYNARTQPVARYNTGNGSRSGGWVSAREVNHPGIAARKFSETFSKQVLPDIRQVIQDAFRRAVRQSQ